MGILTKIPVYRLEKKAAHQNPGRIEIHVKKFDNS